MAALARWHYQKALDLGQPRNTDLEKNCRPRRAGREMTKTDCWIIG